MRDKRLDVYKGLCILGVLWQHLSNRRIDEQIRVYLNVGSNATVWAIWGFIIVSAYLQEARGGKYGVKDEFLERAQRLIVPYFVLGVFYAALYWIAQKGHGSSILDLVFRLFTGKDPIGEQLYFLPLLFFSGVPWMLCCNWERSLRVNVVILIGLGFTYIASTKVLFLTTEFGQGVTIGNIILGVIAFGVGKIYFECRMHNAFNPAMVPIVASIISMLPYALGLDGPAVCALALGILHLVLQWNNVGTSTSKLLAWLGKYSSWIYAYHSPFIIYPTLIFCLAVGFPQIASLTVAVVASIIGSYVTGKIISRLPFRRYFLA